MEVVELLAGDRQPEVIGDVLAVEGHAADREAAGLVRAAAHRHDDGAGRAGDDRAAGHVEADSAGHAVAGLDDVGDHDVLGVFDALRVQNLDELGAAVVLGEGLAVAGVILLVVVVAGLGGAGVLREIPGRLDLLLLDIAMPKVDGLTAARRIRRDDPDVVILFISSVTQYAVQGYSVEALDFIVKPVSYMGLKIRLDRALARIRQSRPRMIEVRNADGLFKLSAMDILYVETFRHRIVIHTRERALPAEKSMQSFERELRGLPFFRCHTSFLVNLRFVDKISGSDLFIGDQAISISRYRRRELLEAWAAYLGDGV